MKTNKLTKRETEVIKMIIKGYHNSTISEELCISKHTTKAHLASIYEKLGVSNRVQAIVKFIQENNGFCLNKDEFQL